MPENKTNRAPLFAVLFTVASCLGMVASLTTTGSALLASFLPLEIGLSFLVMFLYYAYLIALEEKYYLGVFILIIPAALAFFLGVRSANIEPALYEFIDFFGCMLAVVLIYFKSRSNESVASATAVSAFAMFAFTIFSIVTALALKAYIEFSTISEVLFDGIEQFKDLTVQTYQSTLSELAAANPAYDMSAFAVDENLLAESLSTYIIFIPSFIYAVYFFVMLAYCCISDYLRRVLGLSEKHGLTKFEVSTVTHTVFNISVFLMMISFIFEDKLSAFSCGLISVVIVLLPNYLILGIRRIYRLLSKSIPVLLSVIAIFAILLFGLMLSPILLIFVITFLGNSEYRASRRIENSK